MICLQPTEDTLMQHVLRAFIQIIVSNFAHLSQQISQTQHNMPDIICQKYYKQQTHPCNDAEISIVKSNVTINPRSPRLRKRIVFAANLEEIVTFDSPFLAFEELIKRRVYRLQSCSKMRKTQVTFYRSLEAFILQSECQHS